MRLIKMLGLASVAAIAAMAFIGAGSAMAESTQLCTADPIGSTCPAGTAVTSISKEAKNPVLLTGFINVKCEKALMAAAALQLGAPQVFHATELKYTNCNCPITVEQLGLITVLKTANELATVESENFKVKVVCLGFFTCVFSAANPGHGLGPLATGDNGHTTYTEAEAKPFSPSEPCPVAKLDALFVNETPVYIGK